MNPHGSWAAHTLLMFRGMQPHTNQSEMAAAARPWFMLAVGSLMGAGLLAIFLVVGRVPGLHQLFTDPLLFKRCLVVHVDLALIVWIHGFVIALYQLVPGRRIPRLSRIGSQLALGGVLLLLSAACVPGAAPVLANYVPVIDHPLFALGLLLFWAGAALGVLGGPLVPDLSNPPDSRLPASSHVALRAAALMLLVADLSFAGAAVTTPRGLEAQAYWELVAWGGGHVLQFSMMAGMLGMWLHLVRQATGVDALNRSMAEVLFAVLTAPTLVVPVLALRGTTKPEYYAICTTLMQWGIFPVVTVVLVACVHTVRVSVGTWSLRAWLRHPHVSAWLASALLCVAGFVLGASIRGSDTRVPAHYHASIGAVTASCMAVTWWLCAQFNVPALTGRWAALMRWQPLWFGVGQLVFALGFAIAGAPRKTYAGEQVIRSTEQWLGLGVMGVGGLIAVGAGLAFLAAVSRAWLAQQEGGVAWKTENIPSRN